MCVVNSSVHFLREDLSSAAILKQVYYKPGGELHRPFFWLEQFNVPFSGYNSVLNSLQRSRRRSFEGTASQVEAGADACTVEGRSDVQVL